MDSVKAKIQSAELSILLQKRYFLKMYRVKGTKKIGIQVGCSSGEKGVQCSCSESSYRKEDRESRFTTFEDLLRNYLWDKEYMLSWLKEEGLIASMR